MNQIRQKRESNTFQNVINSFIIFFDQFVDCPCDQATITNIVVRDRYIARVISLYREKQAARAAYHIMQRNVNILPEERNSNSFSLKTAREIIDANISRGRTCLERNFVFGRVAGIVGDIKTRRTFLQLQPRFIRVASRRTIGELSKSWSLGRQARGIIRDPAYCPHYTLEKRRHENTASGCPRFPRFRSLSLSSAPARPSANPVESRSITYASTGRSLRVSSDSVSLF